MWSKVLLALGMFVLAACNPASTSSQASNADNAAYDRIMKTQTIRCGYVVYPPNLIKDANTGKLSGISYDIITRIGHDLNLAIEWKEEVGTSSMIEGLNTGRYDLLCTNVWADAGRGKVARFSTPLYFTTINAYTRSDTNRGIGNVASFNTPETTISTIDGGMAAVIARDDFPKAKTYSLPELTDFSQLLLAVTTNKADIAFSEPEQAMLFEKSNPGSLRNLTPGHPVRLFANAFMMGIGENRLAEVLNNDIRFLHYNGFIDKTLDIYDVQASNYRRVAFAYK